jgi:hypothetical protein
MPESTPESTSPIDAPLTPEEREAIRNAFADLCASREELTRMENLAFGPETSRVFTDSLDRSQDRSADRSVDREWAELPRLSPDWLLRLALVSMLVGSSFFLSRVVPHLPHWLQP